MKRFLAFLFLCLLAAPAGAQTNRTLWVRPNGTMGVGLCTSSATEPTNSSGFMSTIADARSCLLTTAGAAAGSSIIVTANTPGGSATFAEPLFAGGIPSGTGSGDTYTNPFTIRAKAGDRITIRANNENNIGIYDPGFDHYSIITGFIFDGINHDVNPQVSIAGINAYVSIEDNEFINTTVNTATLGGQHLRFLRNRVHSGAFHITGGTGGDYGYAFYVGSNDSLFKGNECYDMPSWCFHVLNASGGSNRNTFDGNYCHDQGIEDTRSFCVMVHDGTGNVVTNNKAVRVSRGIGVVSGAAAGTKIYNNLVYDANIAAYQYSSGGTLFTNNLAASSTGACGSSGCFFTDNASSSTFTTNRCTAAGTGCATSGAMGFVNAAADNFRLASGSAAIGIGTTLSSTFTTDFEGSARTVPWDLGPYVAVPPTPSPAIVINTPTTATTWSNSTATRTVGGTATPGSGATLSSITYANDRGGSGACSGTTSWSCPNIALTAGGVNTITITALDSNGGKSTAQIGIAYAVPALIASYGFGEGTGTTVADLSGNGHTGTIVGSATWGSGKYAGGLILSGGHVAIPALSSAVAPVGGVTISLTAKENSVFTDFRALVVSNYSFYLYGSVPAFGACAAGTTFAGAGGLTASGSCDTTPLPAGTNVDIAATYDGLTWKLYKDGVLVSSQAATGNMTTPTGNIQIGCSTFGECSNVTVSEIRIYNRALTLAEIATDRATPLITPAPPVNPPVKFPASATALKLSALNGILKTRP